MFLAAISAVGSSVSGIIETSLEVEFDAKFDGTPKERLDVSLTFLGILLCLSFPSLSQRKTLGDIRPATRQDKNALCPLWAYFSLQPPGHSSCHRAGVDIERHGRISASGGLGQYKMSLVVAIVFCAYQQFSSVNAVVAIGVDTEEELHVGRSVVTSSCGARQG